jgi:hypothetical protein
MGRIVVLGPQDAWRLLTPDLPDRAAEQRYPLSVE